MSLRDLFARVKRNPVGSHRNPTRLGLEQLEDRTLLSASPAQWTDAVYRQLLGRPADDTGLHAWTGMLANGASPMAVVEAIEQSIESRRFQVMDVFAEYLHRAPDDFGLQTFTRFLGQGGTVEEVAALVLGSPEYFEAHGGSAEAFVPALFHSVLGREPEAFGVDQFATALAHGSSRAGIAEAVLGSPEAHQRMTYGLYDRVFHRKPDVPGWNRWDLRWLHGTTYCQVVAGFLGSPEFQDRAASETPPEDPAPRIASFSTIVPHGFGQACITAFIDGTGAPDTPPAPLSPDSSSCNGDCTAPGSYDMAEGGPKESPAGIDYFDGGITRGGGDQLLSDGFGRAWGQAPAFTNRLGTMAVNGKGMVNRFLPFLQELDGPDLVLITLSNRDWRYFDKVGSAYVPRHYIQDRLEHNDTTDEYTYTDTCGQTLVFKDGSASNCQAGQFVKATDPDGHETAVQGYNASGSPTEIRRSTGTGSSDVTESYLFTYLGSGPNEGKLSNVTLRRRIGTGSWSTIRQVDYSYYGGSESHGNTGNLKLATEKDASGNALNTWYWRWYTGESGGYIGGLKYLLGPQSYARATADLGDVTTADDEDIAPFADAFYEYGMDHWVTLVSLPEMFAVLAA